jgi:CheY-like chemotaxis protein
MSTGKPIILVIDDNRTIRNIIVQTISLITPINICVQAENGKAALEKLTQIRSEYSRDPNLIVCDLEMPVMDGWDFIKEMKKECKANNQDVGIPIIVLSASTGEEGVFLFKKSVHDNKTGYIPLVTIAKDDCVNPKKYETSQEKGFVGWVKYFLSDHKWQ